MATQRDIIGVGWRFPLSVDGRGRIAFSDGADEIEEAIEIILNTSKGQRVMRPEFGCRIHELIFAPINAGTITAAIRYVEEAIGYWEPRVSQVSVAAEPDPKNPACLLITIFYRVKATNDARGLVYPFYAIPTEI